LSERVADALEDFVLVHGNLLSWLDLMSANAVGVVDCCNVFGVA